MTTRDPMANGRVPDGGSPSTGERIRKPKLERTKPLRILSAYGRFDDPRGAEATGGAGRAFSSSRDVIEHAIRVAYEVIEDQIDAGQRIATHLGKTPPRKKKRHARDGGTLTARSLALYRELGELSAEVLAMVLRSPALLSMLSRMLSGDTVIGGAVPPPPSSDPKPAPTCSIQVVAGSPTEVKVALFPCVRLDDAVVMPLHARHAENGAINEVLLVHEPHLALRVRVPDGQPPDVYTGTIIGQHSSEPLGTVVAHVYPNSM